MRDHARRPRALRRPRCAGCTKKARSPRAQASRSASSQARLVAARHQRPSRPAPGPRPLVEDARRQLASQRERQRAGDGRSAERQQVGPRRLPLSHQHQALRDAEALLLVDHDQTQPRELDLVLQQRVRADHDLRLPDAMAASTALRSAARMPAASRSTRRPRPRRAARPHPGTGRRAPRWGRAARTGNPPPRTARPRPAPPPSCRCRRPHEQPPHGQRRVEIARRWPRSPAAVRPSAGTRAPRRSGATAAGPGQHRRARSAPLRLGQLALPHAREGLDPRETLASARCAPAPEVSRSDAP